MTNTWLGLHLPILFMYSCRKAEELFNEREFERQFAWKPRVQAV